MNPQHELRRLHYLQAMGVPVYVSRRGLLGARDTQKLMLKKAPADTVTHSQRAIATAGVGLSNSDQGYTQKPPGEGIPEALRESLRSKERGTPAAAPTPTAPASRVSPQDDQAAAKFQLAIVMVGRRLWIEDISGEALAQDQLRLITAMARAIEHPQTPIEEPTVAQFNWPMVEGQPLALGPEEAKASLEGFLQRKLDEAACVELVCLGELAWQRAQSLALPCARRQSLATRELLQKPLLKAQAWAALRA